MRYSRFIGQAGTQANRDRCDRGGRRILYDIEQSVDMVGEGEVDQEVSYVTTNRMDCMV